MKNITAITATYSKRTKKTTFECVRCGKIWILEGKESDLKAGERLFLLNHDRSHKP
jgi:hypothetical protein